MLHGRVTVTMRFLFTALLLVGLHAGAASQSRLETFRQNEHYVVLPVPTATASGGESHAGEVVQVLFSYACFDCYRLEPMLETWAQQLPDQARFERVPAVFSADWLLLARAFYVAEICGVLDLTHGAMFSAIHEGGQAFQDATEVAAFYSERVRAADARRCRSRADFLAAFASLEVAQAVQQALALSRVWQVGSVPSLVVAGRWRTAGRLTGAYPAMFDVAEYLLRRGRAEAQSGDGDSDY